MTETATARRQTSRKQAGPTEKKSTPTPKRAPAKRAAPISARIQDAPIGRFAKLLTEIEQPEPYEVTANCSIMPPDKDRMELMVSSQTAYIIARGQLDALTSPIVDDEGNMVLDENKQPIMPSVNREQIDNLEALVKRAAEQYDRAVFGDAYDEVMRLSRKWTGAVWNAFFKDVQDTFLPIPEGGLCPTCGNVANQEEAGKPLASETSSNSIGTSSKETSLPT